MLLPIFLPIMRSICEEKRILTKIFVDTGFIFALINEKDQYHQKALELEDKFGGNYWLMTEAILLEIGNALAKNYKPQAVEFIEKCLASDEVEVVKITPYLFTQSLELYKYLDKKWGLVDCFSFAVMREKRVTQALTFDDHFSQAGFQILTVN